VTDEDEVAMEEAMAAAVDEVEDANATMIAEQRTGR
jgi:hypothetical protein